jgi:hypothetical protein
MPNMKTILTTAAIALVVVMLYGRYNSTKVVPVPAPEADPAV